jgi:Mg-chelatase subunit ChlD
MFSSLRLMRFCFILVMALSSCLLPAFSSAQQPKLEAALCTQVNMVTGEFTPVSALQAGGKGFMVALTSKHDNSLTVTAVWEAVNASGIKRGTKLGEDQVLVAPGKTKFIPFRASDGLIPGDYRILLKVADQGDIEKAFQIKPAPAANTDGKENVTQALQRAFKENKGPDAVKAGAKVMTHFFDKELGGPGEKPSKDPTTSQSSAPTQVGRSKYAAKAPPAPSMPNTGPGADSGASGSPTATATPAPTAGKTSATAQAPAPTQAAPAAAGKTLPAPSGAGVTAVTTLSVDAKKAPLDAASQFDENAPKIFLALRSNDPALKDIVKVQWLAMEVEGLPAGMKVSSDSTVLRVGQWNTAVFMQPIGGFWPGSYQVVVTKGDRPLAQVVFNITSKLQTAQLLSEAKPAAGYNLAQAELGGKAVSATSQRNDTYWAKENLIDGFGFGGKNCSPHCGWASKDRKLPQELIFSFRNQGEAKLSGVVLDTESCSGKNSCLGSLPRLVEVWVSNQGPGGGPDQGYKLAASKRLRPKADKHLIPLNGVPAKFVKLVIKSNYGSARRTQLAEFRILEEPGEKSLVGDLELDLTMPSLGGSLIRYTSQKYGREAAKLLTNQEPGKGWRSYKNKLPQEFMFAFRDGGEALIDRIELVPDLKADPGSRPKLVTVEASSISPTEGFTEIVRVDFPAQAASMKIPLNKRARFLKLRILENQGGKYTSLGKVRIIEGKAPGYVSLLARPQVLEMEGFAIAPPDPSLVTSKVQPGDSAENAPQLELGKRIKASFKEYSKKHYYALKLEGDRPGMLNLELMGQPFLRIKATLLDKDGQPVAIFSPEKNSPKRTIVSWRLQPGQYKLMVETTPANIVLAYDVSGSMSEHTDLLQKAVTGFLKQVRPSEKVNLIPFNNNVLVLLDSFSNDQAQLLAAVKGKFKAEMATRLRDAIAQGIKLLKEAKGAGVMLVMTDGVDQGSVTPVPEFWEKMASNPVRIFSLGLGGELKVNDPKTGISGERFLSYVAQSTGGRYIPIPNVAQLVEAYEKIAGELMSGTTYYILPTWTFNPGTLMVEAQGEKIVQVAAPPRIELILDGSGSMKKKIKGRTRMAVAKEVLKDIIQKLPEGVEVALRVYGHRIREGHKGACQDTELVYRFGKLDKKKLIRQVMAIKPLGTTPIAYSLKQTVKDFGEAPGIKTVILVTDGKEECGGDLKATVEELQKQGLDVKLHIVGFTVADPKVQKQMKDAAAAGKGQFISAMDSAGLKKAMEQTLALPFKILDSKGMEVASGTAGKELSLPAGYYRVVFDTPQGEMIQDEVEVVEAQTTLLRITKDGPKIGIQTVAPGAAE